ncbi:MAG: twin-arginine translocase TatA/TatE family subunit [Verrucomicrobiota bacterium]
MSMPLPIAFLGTTEIFVILGIVVLMFGARKIPELMKGVGTGIKEFKKASKEVTNDLSDPPGGSGPKSA